MTRLLRLDLLDRPGDHFFSGDGGFLVIADGHPGRGPGHELPGASAGRDDELERVGQLASVDHENVLTMCSAWVTICFNNERVERTMLRRRSTAAVMSSLMTMNSYSAKLETSVRATCSRRSIDSPLSLLRARSR